MIDYERPIKNALARLGNPDIDQRMWVYRSAMQAFENKNGNTNAANQNERRDLLTSAIQMIEREYATAVVAPAVASMPVEPISPIEPTLIFATIANKLRSLIGKTNARYLVGAIIAIVIGMGVVLTLTGRETPPETAITASRTPITSSLSEAEVSTLFDASFAGGNGLLSLAPNAKDTISDHVTLVSDGTIRASGIKKKKRKSEYVGMYSNDLIEISPQKIYSATAYIRYNNHRDVTALPNVYIGIATFTKDQIQEDAKSGDHRYFVINGQPPIRSKPDKDGWIKLTGQITGVGNNSHKKFKSGSDYARPVVLVSTRPVRSTVELKSFTFGEIE